MARFALAASLLALLAFENVVADGDDHSSDAWSYLTATLPTPLSDMSVVRLVEGEKKRIVITGGCDHPDGNVFVDAFGGIFECPSLSNKAYFFDPIHPHSQFQAWNGEFEALTDMPRKRARHASAVVSGRVCVFGGRNESDALIAEVDCYDPESKQWTTPTILPADVQSSDWTAYATETDQVYLIGGYTTDYIALDTTTKVDMSDFDAIAYSDGPALRGERGDIDVAVIGTDVYVSGGFTHENNYTSPLNTVERYDAATGEWSEVDSLNQERGDKQLVALNGRVYALGGEAKVDVTGVPSDELPHIGGMSVVLDSVEVLDPSEDVHAGLAQWRSLGGMPGQLFRFGAAGWEVEGEDGYVFVFGGQGAYDDGCNCFRTTDKVLVFDVGQAEKEAADGGKKGSNGGAGVFAGSAAALVLLSSAAAASLLGLV